MTKMLIASSTEEESALFRKQVGPLLGTCYSPVMPETHINSVLQALDHRIGLVVLNLRLIRASHLHLVREIRTSGYSGWILMVGRAYGPDVVIKCKKMDNVHFIERPYEKEDLLGILRKIAKNNLVRQRVFRRFRTLQNTKLQSYMKDDAADGVIHNLSRGGAYIEGGSLAHFRVGELVKLHVNLNEMDKNYAVPARVVWLNEIKDKTQTGVGLEFVRNDEVYKFLLNSM